MTPRLLAAAATLLTLAVLGALVAITRDQGAAPAWWFVAPLLLSTVGLGYGTGTGPGRSTVLLVAGVVTGLLGVLALLTVGLPLVVAGALGVLAARVPPVRSDAAVP